MKSTLNNRNPDINYRLTKLEEFYLSLSAHFEGERLLRKEEDQKCKQLCELISNQIMEIKDKQPNESFIKRFASLKEQLLNIIDLKIGEKIVENKNRLEKISEKTEERLKIILNYYKKKGKIKKTDKYFNQHSLIIVLTLREIELIKEKLKKTL